MHKALVLAIKAAIVLALILATAALSTHTQACTATKCYQVDVTRTAANRAQGLMNTDQLQTNHGLLMIFEEPGLHPIWMKNMKYPLDLVWITPEGKITHIERDVQPCHEADCPHYTDPTGQSTKVLEINADSNLKEGEQITTKRAFTKPAR